MNPASIRRRVNLIRDMQQASFAWLEQYATTKVQHRSYLGKREFLATDRKLYRAVRALENHIFLTGEDALYDALGCPKNPH